MILHVMSVGSMGANCYIIGCEKTMQAAVIDPGGDGRLIIQKIEQLGLKLKYIIATHGHVDHIMAVDEVKAATGAKVLVHKEDAPLFKDTRENLSMFVGTRVVLDEPDQLLSDGDVLKLGELQIKVLHTPGHTRGGICLLVEDNLFSGDTLFAGSIGRTDFPGGNYDRLIASIKNKLLPLPDNTRVYAGHMQASSIGEEKKYNPFLK